MLKIRRLERLDVMRLKLLRREFALLFWKIRTIPIIWNMCIHVTFLACFMGELPDLVRTCKTQQD